MKVAWPWRKKRSVIDEDGKTPLRNRENAKEEINREKEYSALPCKMGRMGRLLTKLPTSIK